LEAPPNKSLKIPAEKKGVLQQSLGATDHFSNIKVIPQSLRYEKKGKKTLRKEECTLMPLPNREGEESDLVFSKTVAIRQVREEKGVQRNKEIGRGKWEKGKKQSSLEVGKRGKTDPCTNKKTRPLGKKKK